MVVAWRLLGVSLLDRRDQRRRYEALTDALWDGVEGEAHFDALCARYDAVAVRRSWPSLDDLDGMCD